MSWITAFELLCYLIVALMLTDLIRRKDYNSLFTFGAAAIVGFTMELLAVAVTDIYYYNPGFWINIGSVPKQFPVFGGFMWGGLTVYGIKLAQKLHFGKFLTALCAGMLIVTMDILLDVVAIRLGGGFWTWVGRPITTDITQSAFMSVIWVNFLGYMIETPAVVWFTLKKREKVKETDWQRQSISMLFIALGSIVVTAIGSLIALGLNAVTNDWFACIVFIAIWLTMFVAIVKQAIRENLHFANPKQWDIAMLVFWMAIYSYCLAGLLSLGFASTVLWFFILGVIFMLATLSLGISSSAKEA